MRAALRWLRAQSSRSPVFRYSCLGDCSALLLTGLAIVGVAASAFRTFLAASPSARKVARDTCDCSCWDGAFKNGYSTSGYKTIHFSLDERLVPIVLWVSAFLLMAVALARAAARTLLAGEARLPIALALVLSIYPHFYSLWAGWNYLNEGDTKLLPTQLVFALTEVLASAAAAVQLSTRTPLAPRALWAMIGIAAVHAWHNVFDWTSGFAAMPIILVADVLSAAVACGYLATCLGRRAEPWFVTVQAEGAAGSRGGGEEEEEEEQVGEGAKARGGGAATTAPLPPRAAAAAAATASNAVAVYSPRDALGDGLATLAAVVVASTLLKALQNATA